jgi:superfamily I DNA and/or RNA helicase
MPHWDVLIVDEASKTLIQEFMVPALMAKRWIVVGDVRQLPPFRGPRRHRGEPARPRG